MDQDQMWQCVDNLLNNAAEAALQRPDPRTRLNIDLVSEGVRFRVQDTGPGILPQQEDQIFQPFYTSKVEGNGVGLTLARQIIQAHGAHLRLDLERSADDLAGACFTFNIASAANN